MAMYQTDDKGYITNTDYNWWLGTFDPNAIANEQYILQHNTALAQYNEQMGFAREQFDESKKNNAFNRDMALKSYELTKNGVANEARQLQALGINPASGGAGLSGTSFSGGSVPSASAPIPSGRGTAGSLGAGGFSNILGLLTGVMSIVKGSEEIKNLRVQNDNLKKQGESLDANISYTQAQTEAIQIQNQVDKGDCSSLEALGMSRRQFDSLVGIEISATRAVAVANSLGLKLSVADFGANASFSDSDSIKVRGDALAVMLNGMDKDISGSRIFKAIYDSSGAQTAGGPNESYVRGLFARDPGFKKLSESQQNVIVRNLGARSINEINDSLDVFNNRWFMDVLKLSSAEINTIIERMFR